MTTDDRGLRRTGRNWERLAAADPYWAALSDDGKLGNWDVDEFLASGAEHVRWILAYVAELGVPVVRRRALDFGCGPGRFTGALADEFEAVDAIDISETMITRARQLHGERVQFHVNPRPDLSLFEDGRFDFVLRTSSCSTSRRRWRSVTSPSSCACSRPVVSPRSRRPPNSCDRGRSPTPGSSAAACAMSSRAKGAMLRRPVMEMHMLPSEAVTDVVVAAGGEVVEVADDWTGGDFCRSVRYVVRRPAGT